MSAATSNVVAMPTKSLAAALVEAQRHAKAVEKGNRNDHHRYKYASAEAIIEEAREALSSAGLALMPLGWALSEDKSKLRVRYRLFHVGGESLDLDCETSVVPEKGRPQDKAEATALTYDLGYLLRGLLLLPRVDEGHDVDQRDDRGHAPAQRTSAPQKVDFADFERWARNRIAEIVVVGEEKDLKEVSSEIQRLVPKEHPLRLELAGAYAEAQQAIRKAKASR